MKFQILLHMWVFFLMYTFTFINIFAFYFTSHMWFLWYVYISFSLFLSFIWVIFLWFKYESLTFFWRLIGVAIACIFLKKNYQHIFLSWTIEVSTKDKIKIQHSTMSNACIVYYEVFFEKWRYEPGYRFYCLWLYGGQWGFLRGLGK